MSRFLPPVKRSGLSTTNGWCLIRLSNVSVSAETSIREAARILAKRNFSRLPVAQGGEVIGIATDTDIVQAVERFVWGGDAS